MLKSDLRGIEIALQAERVHQFEQLKSDLRGIEMLHDRY